MDLEKNFRILQKGPEPKGVLKFILIIFALFQQPDVHDDTQDCDVQHGYRHCAH